jgi:hypothetical protein
MHIITGSCCTGIYRYIQVGTGDVYFTLCYMTCNSIYVIPHMYSIYVVMMLHNLCTNLYAAELIVAWYGF